MRISVIGGSRIDESGERIATAVGRAVASRGHTLVCGGLGGTMAAACRGASEAGGRTIGIVPGEDPGTANEFVTVPIATGLGHQRNALVVLNGDGVVALPGGAGTLSELGFAGIYERPVAGIDTHDVPGVHPVEDPEAAVTYLEEAVPDEG